MVMLKIIVSDSAICIKWNLHLSSTCDAKKESKQEFFKMSCLERKTAIKIELKGN